MDKLTVIAVDQAGFVTLRSTKEEIVAFRWPCNLNVGDVIENRLHTLDAHTLATYLSDWPEDEKEALSVEWIEPANKYGRHAYRGRGRVIDQAAGLVEVQGFIVEMEVLCDGYVDFDVSRFDL